MAFSRFASLPDELQLQVWEACRPPTAMHIFDVRAPQSKENGYALQEPSMLSEALQKDGNEVAAKTTDDLGVTVFLDALCTKDSEPGQVNRATRYDFDPSMYRFEESLRRASKTSRSAMLAISRKAEKNHIHLPRRHRTLEIPRSDVIMLRFQNRREAGLAAGRTIFRDDENISSTSLGQVLEGQWSPQMAQTLRSATKIALDLTEDWIAELGGELAYEEIAFLACTMQHDLEVLFLVDNCVGRCAACGNRDLQARDLQKRGVLWQCLNYQDRHAQERSEDVIEAVSKVYIEVADFEQLGWTDTHPYFVFARMIDEMIRSQQHGESKGRFQGVRILIAEDQEIGSHATGMQVCCTGGRSKESAIGLAFGLLPAYGGVWKE